MNNLYEVIIAKGKKPPIIRRLFLRGGDLLSIIIPILFMEFLKIHFLR